MTKPAYMQVAKAVQTTTTQKRWAPPDVLRLIMLFTAVAQRTTWSFKHFSKQRPLRPLIIPRIGRLGVPQRRISSDLFYLIFSHKVETIRLLET
jgi:hypothetical protein